MCYHSDKLVQTHELSQVATYGNQMKEAQMSLMLVSPYFHFLYLFVYFMAKAESFPKLPSHKLLNCFGCNFLNIFSLKETVTLPGEFHLMASLEKM